MIEEINDLSKRFDLSELSNILEKNGTNEDLAQSIAVCYESLVNEYGDEYLEIINSAILSCKYVIANNFTLNEKGKKTKIIEKPKDVLTRLNFDLKFVSKESLEKEFIYASMPFINNYEIKSVDRVIVMPYGFNDNSYNYQGMLINALNTLITSYMNEYTIDDNILIRRSGMALYRYDLNTYNLISEKGIGLQEGLNSSNELKIMRNDFYKDYDLNTNFNDLRIIAEVIKNGGLKNE